MPWELEKYTQEFDLAHDWEALLPLLGKIIEIWLWDFLAAMDAEWGLNYFPGMASQPYFLWMAPRTPLARQETMEIKSKRNIVYHPVRRLLEFSHAFMVRSKLRHWPDQPVGRKELGLDSDTTEALIGGYFDGTKLMRVKDFEHIWYQMYKRMPTRDGIVIAECPVEPLTLVHTALPFQRLLVRAGATKNSKTFVILDEVSYRTCWARHLGVVSSQPKTGVVDWPEWWLSCSLDLLVKLPQTIGVKPLFQKALP